MKKILSILFILLFYFTVCYAQESTTVKKSKLKDNLVFGGNFGLSLGTNTYIDLSPTVGYKFGDRYIAGVGVVYNYYSSTYYDFRTNIYGGKVFNSFLVYDNIFIHGEYEVLSLESQYFDYALKHQNETRFYSAGLLIGGGYRQYFSERSYASVMILFNLNDTPNSIYQNPIIRIGINF